MQNSALIRNLQFCASRDALAHMLSIDVNGPAHPTTRSFASAAEFSIARFVSAFEQPSDCSEMWADAK